MYVLGINIPLAEFLFVIVLILLFCLVVIIFHLRKLEQMTAEERAELQELEKITLEEKDAIDKIAGIETTEKEDLNKFEKNIKELEIDTETIYLKKIVPDIYKLQNYTLWALKKGMTPKEIKDKLMDKGWKDEALIDMVIDDMSKYVKYYRVRKGKVDVPVVKVEETKKIIKPTKIITKEVKPKPKKKAKKPAKKKPTKKKKPSAKKKKKKSELDSVEAELKKLEKEISATGKKSKKTAKKGSKKKGRKSAAIKKSTKKKAAKKSPSKSKGKDLLIGTKGGNKYHNSTCIVMKKVPKDKVVTFKSSNEALKKGYKPCTVCSVESRD